MTVTNDAVQDLPDPGQLQSILRAQIERWQPRNQLIKRLREAVAGQNPIKAPANTSYKVVVAHAYHLAAAISEKAARFEPIPNVKVFPHGIGKLALAASSRTEKWINRAFELIEEQSGGDSYGNQLLDAILTDGGVRRIERAAAACWPEFTVVIDKDGKPTEEEKLFAKGYKNGDVVRPFQSEEEYKRYREIYKENCPFPMRAIYVPHEAFLPDWDGVTMVAASEIERRPISGVLKNKLFDGPGLAYLQGQAADYRGRDKNLQCVILHYSDQKYHSYWALAPDRDSRYANRWPDALSPNKLSIGTPQLLHAYKHGIGRPQYNYMAGRAGGWRGTNNPHMESIIEALLELGQDADDVLSQWMTNTRHQGWPTLVAYYDPDARNLSADDNVPPPPQIQEGQHLSMWKDEKLENVFKPMMPENVEALLKFTRERIGELAGAANVYGGRTPGITTGYHESISIAQAEHLDNKLEDNVCAAVTDWARLIFLHARELGETLPVFALQRRKGAEGPVGRTYGNYVALGPADFVIPPQMAAKVISTRPQDVMQQLQAFDLATRDRRGSGTPALDDDTARDIFLPQIEASDEVSDRITIQNAKQYAHQQGVVNQEVAQRLQLELIKRGTPQVTPETVAGADPALTQTAFQMGATGEAALSPGMAGAIASHSVPLPTGNGVMEARTGTGGGPAPGAAQVPQTLGRARQLLAQPMAQ